MKSSQKPSPNHLSILFSHTKSSSVAVKSSMVVEEVVVDMFLVVLAADEVIEVVIVVFVVEGGEVDGVATLPQAFGTSRI